MLPLQVTLRGAWRVFPVWDGPVATGAEEMKLMLPEHVKPTGG